MKYFFIAIPILLILMGSGLFIQNQKPHIQLGIEDGKLKEIPNKQNAVSTQTVYEDKRIEALPLKETLNDSKQAMKQSLVAYGGIRIIEERDDYIYAIATTGKMKFHDDIEIYFDVKNNCIQYRSASRAGYSDMGLNRERYNQIASTY